MTMPNQNLNGGRLVGHGTTNCIIEHNGKIYRVSMEPYKDAIEIRYKEERIKDLLRDVPDRDERFGFSIDNSTISATMSVVKSKSYQVYSDILECNSQQDISLTDKFIFTQYKALQKMPRKFTLAEKDYLRESLRILHDHGIYHFDIKENLGNIMWNGTNPVIIDFDLARINPLEEYRALDAFDFEALEMPFIEADRLEKKQQAKLKRTRAEFDDHEAKSKFAF